MGANYFGGATRRVGRTVPHRRGAIGILSAVRTSALPNRGMTWPVHHEMWFGSPTDPVRLEMDERIISDLSVVPTLLYVDCAAHSFVVVNQQPSWFGDGDWLPFDLTTTEAQMYDVLVFDIRPRRVADNLAFHVRPRLRVYGRTQEGRRLKLLTSYKG